MCRECNEINERLMEEAESEKQNQISVPITPYIPRTVQEHWCQKCDCILVNSGEPETGKFFLISGHSYNRSTQEYDGDFYPVMFAVCASCLK